PGAVPVSTPRSARPFRPAQRRHDMHDDANFLADTADIRALLAGTDSAPEALEPGAAMRMSAIRDGIVTNGGKVRRLRTSPRPVLAAAWTGLAAAVAVAATLGGLMLRAGPPHA